MVKKTNAPEDLIAQFQEIIESSISSEYKQVLQDFKKQGAFYTQLLQNIKKNDSTLDSFWHLPETLGFGQVSTKNANTLSSFFDINQAATDSVASLSEQFSEKLSRFTQTTQKSFSDFQQALNKMSTLHTTLNQRASERFNTLCEGAKNDSDESLCQHWLQAGEEAFNEISQQTDYVETQRTLFESLGALKETQKDFNDQYTQLLGLPQRQEINELVSGLHTLRIEFATYREETTALITQLTQASLSTKEANKQKHKKAPKTVLKKTAKKPTKI